MEENSVKSGFEAGDVVQARSYMPCGTQDFVAPGTHGTVREKDPSSGLYLVEFEKGGQVRANADMIGPV
ncbi:MAG: hypothetical protein ABIH23_01605 [bacterium]